MNDVEDTVRDFWATRPRRPVVDRKVGGVAAAIANRYRIDPVLVRVAFVVATLFSGVGLLLYLLGWLLLPAQDDEVSAAESLLGRGRSSMSPVLTVLLSLALIPAAGVVLGGNAFGVVGLAAAGAAVFLLHRSRAALGQAPMPHTQQTVTGAGSDRPVPPAWDPLGAAPFAWDLPEPAPVPPPLPPPARGPRSKVTPITLGLALLAGGIASALWPALAAAHILAIVLAVVGLGLVIGSLVRGGRGLIAIALPLALLTWVLAAVPVSGLQMTERRWTAATVAQVQPRYELTMGAGILDLTELRMADDQTVTSTVVLGTGDLRVILPPQVDAQVACRAGLGEVRCLGRDSSGLDAEVVARSTGTDGPGGGTLILNVRAGSGVVKVERGS
ncbi:MAG: PspC domain-containing protein [Pseudonocardiaceae bacterium]